MTKAIVKLRDAGTIFYDMDSDVSVTGSGECEVTVTRKVADAVLHGILIKVKDVKDAPSQTDTEAADKAAEELKAKQEEEKAAEEKAAAIEHLKTANIDKLSYPVVQHLVGVLELELPDKKQATAVEALKDFRATLKTK